MRTLDLRMLEVRVGVDPIHQLQAVAKPITALAEFYVGKLTWNASFDSDWPALDRSTTNLKRP